jgi:hypothetical protein
MLFVCKSGTTRAGAALADKARFFKIPRQSADVFTDNPPTFLPPESCFLPSFHQGVLGVSAEAPKGRFCGPHPPPSPPPPSQAAFLTKPVRPRTCPPTPAYPHNVLPPATPLHSSTLPSAALSTPSRRHHRIPLHPQPPPPPIPTPPPPPHQPR